MSFHTRIGGYPEEHVRPCLPCVFCFDECALGSAKNHQDELL